MNLRIHPARGLTGEVTVPGDKSLSHRAALFAALAEGESEINGFQVSGVTRAMLDALAALGVTWRLEGTRLTVTGRGLHGWAAPDKAIDCRNSATTFRLLAGAVAATGVGATLDGSAGLRKRPMDRIVGPLREMGVPVSGADGAHAPLVFAPRPPAARLRAARFDLPVASAQVKSCLILAALAADAPVTIAEPGPSRDHTERMLAAMGAIVNADENRHEVTVFPLVRPLRPLVIELPGDFSAAAFLVVAALITPGSDILIKNVGINPTRTGLIDVLRAMGGNIALQHTRGVSGEPAGDLRVRWSNLCGTVVEGDLVVRMIDEFPVFAVAAAHARGTTVIRDAEELRFKESDRIARLCGELRKLGANVSESDDGFRIEGGHLWGAVVEAHGDHRLAMSLAVAGLVAEGNVTVRDAEIIAESFPDFTAVMRRLGASLDDERVQGWGVT